MHIIQHIVSIMYSASLLLSVHLECIYSECVYERDNHLWACSRHSCMCFSPNSGKLNTSTRIECVLVFDADYANYKHIANGQQHIFLYIIHMQLRAMFCLPDTVNQSKPTIVTVFPLICHQNGTIHSHPDCTFYNLCTKQLLTNPFLLLYYWLLIWKKMI